MVKEIIKDTSYLILKSEPANINDLYILNDLTDTLDGIKDKCVGLAANMIGYNKTILVFIENNKISYMINPKIIKKEDEYETEEGCMSLIGLRKCIRYNKIKVSYYNDKFQERIKNYAGFEAEIIQHEIDHFSGILI